jgi:hypothetical protein
VLSNAYRRPAVARVIETLPYHETGSSSDHALAPNARLGAGAEQEVLFPCDMGELPALEVVAVVYDDTSIAGDRTVLVERIVRSRLTRAAGLEELTHLLRSARSTAGAGNDPTNEIAELIARSAGPQIDARVRAEAATVLSRVLYRRSASSSPATFASVISSLGTELDQSVEALRAITPHKDK